MSTQTTPLYRIHNNGAITTAPRQLTRMDRVRAVVMSGIRAGHTKQTIMEELRYRGMPCQIDITEPNVLAYIDGIFDAIEALGVKC